MYALFGNSMCSHQTANIFLLLSRFCTYRKFLCARGVSLHTVRFAVVYLTALWAKISSHLFDNCHPSRVNFHDTFALANFQLHTPCIFKMSQLFLLTLTLWVFTYFLTTNRNILIHRQTKTYF